ncbi:UNVERIFIED_CONTAM: Bet1-like protein [Sesamum angustifolium]|uniref:Bet1-like protein n=1 Tax=Sesamum angustifolium TaxID=2727405 RepID=A0AAW2LIV2_9LAMI
MADPYRSREGLSTRSSSAAYGGYSDEVQVRIDPDFDDEVTGLRKLVRRLRDVAQDIETEAKSQNDFLNQLSAVVSVETGPLFFWRNRVNEKFDEVKDAITCYYTEASF